MSWQDIDLSADEASLTETRCECCQSKTIQISGSLSKESCYLGWYSARFSEDMNAHFPIITIFVGDWSKDATREKRWAARAMWHSQGCELLDWESDLNVNFTPLNRDEILGTEFAAEFWTLIDTVIMKEPRLEKLRS